MLPGNNKIVLMTAPTTELAAASTNTANIDTIKFDYLTIDLCTDTGTEATAALTVLSIAESDIATQVFTNMDAIVAGTGAAATSTSAGFALPWHSSVCVNNYRFNIDLKGRKRYIGIHYENPVGGAISITGTLSRHEDGDPMPVAALASTVETVTTIAANCRLNVAF